MDQKPSWTDLVHNLCQAIPGSAHMIEADLKRCFQDIVRDWCQQAQLVSREEFDAQKRVLQRTRQLVEQLEAQIAQWEAQPCSVSGQTSKGSDGTSTTGF